MNRRRKISVRQKYQLLQIYLHMGQEIVGPICLEWGVSRKYASSIAAAEGYSRPIWRAGNRYKDSHGNLTSRRELSDRRWQWAIARGAVVA